MGKLSRMKAVKKVKPKIIHTKKLFDGKETAEEVHRELAWGKHAKCEICNDKLVTIRISCAMSPKDLVERTPLIAARIMAASDNGQIPSFLSKYGPMTWFSEVFSCATHQAALERSAAHLPSHVLVEIDRGPGKDKVVSQVPRTWQHVANG